MYSDQHALKEGLAHIRNSPKSNGRVDMIVCRPETGSRQVLEQGELSVVEGLVGDNWKQRELSSSRPASAMIDMQINIMNSRAIALIANDKERWPLAGDQFFASSTFARDQHCG